MKKIQDIFTIMVYNLFYMITNYKINYIYKSNRNYVLRRIVP